MVAHAPSTSHPPAGRRRLVAPLVAACATAAVVAPLAARGWLLLLDWTPGPRTALADRIFAGRSLPAGPLFFAAAAVLRAMFGAGASWLVPALALFVGGWGAGRLLRDCPPAAQAATAAAYVVNPFAHERLYAGQVAVLAGTAALPWIVGSALRRPAAARATIATGAITAIGIALDVHLAWIAAPPLLAALVAGDLPPGAVRVRLGAGLRSAGLLGVVVALLTLPWLVPLVPDAPSPGGRPAAGAFATQTDTELGLYGGLAAQGGFWRPARIAPAAPLGPLRLPALAGIAACATLGLVLTERGGRCAGNAATRTAGERKVDRSRALVVVALVSIVAGIALGAGVRGMLGPAYALAIDEVPGFAVMREAQKFVILVTFGTSIGLGLFVRLVAQRLPSRKEGMTYLAAPLFPLLLAPGMVWGMKGSIKPSRFPPSWVDVQRLVAVDGRNVMVLPWAHYLDPGFTDGRVVASPAPGYFGPRALVSEDPGLAGLPFDTAAEDLVRALSLPCHSMADQLESRGVGWVLVSGWQPQLPGRADERCPQLKLRLDRPDLRLYEIQAEEIRSRR